jgi:hypothetical protein
MHRGMDDLALAMRMLSMQKGLSNLVSQVYAILQSIPAPQLTSYSAVHPSIIGMTSTEPVLA